MEKLRSTCSVGKEGEEGSPGQEHRTGGGIGESKAPNNWSAKCPEIVDMDQKGF